MTIVYPKSTAADDIINVRSYGAVGDGSTDDTTAIQSAITDASINSGTLFIPKGYTFRITENISTAANLHIFGGGTIITDVSGNGLTFTGDSVVIEDITFDGNTNDTVNVALNLSTLSWAKISNCTFQNVDSDTYVKALNIAYVIDFLVTNCRFNNITCLANNVGGDTNGSCRALVVHGGPTKGVIEGCIFENVNNRTAGDAFDYEDADAIQIYGTGTGIADTLITNCKFYNCGKRAIKNNPDSGSRCVISDITIKSNYTDTADNSTAEANGMFSCVSSFAGSLKVNNLNLLDGVCAYGVIANGENVEHVTVSNCTLHFEPHRYANTQQVIGVYIYNTVPSTADIVINNNSIKGCHIAVNAAGGGKLVLNGNTLKSLGQTVSIHANCDVNATGNNIDFENRLTWIDYTGGEGVVPSSGQVVEGSGSGATGTIAYIDVDTGSFAGQNAAGDLLLHDVSGTFTDGETLILPSGASADVDGFLDRYGIYMGDGIGSVSLVGNNIKNMKDGIYLASQSGSFKFNMVANNFDGISRNELTNQTSVTNWKAYSETGVVTSRAFDPQTVDTSGLGNIVGTLIADLRAQGIVS